MKELVIIRGVPGTGKSTLAKDKAFNAYKLFEADQYFMVDGEYVFNINCIRQSHEWCQSLAFESMRKGEGVVVSNTFTRYREMKPYVEAARQYGYDIRVITLTNEYGSVHNVPEEAMQRMRDRFQTHQDILGRVFS